MNYFKYYGPIFINNSNDKVFDFISETFQLNRVEAISALFLFLEIHGG
jgi:hypothetical protein